MKLNIGQADYISLGVNFTVGLCVAVLFTSILINFIESKHNEKVKREKKSIVETGTMTLFFFFFYYLIRFNIGFFPVDYLHIRVFLLVVGLFLIIFGCIINVKGRLRLGSNWANHIKIYENQTLVRQGVYKLVRHPLYASIIWMFYGASIVYQNYAAFMANTLIFIPFMYYRAKQEEELLKRQFGDYIEYQVTTGMFFPKIVKGVRK